MKLILYLKQDELKTRVSEEILTVNLDLCQNHSKENKRETERRLTN